jgi:uncharacterized protein YaeQ
MPAHTPLSDLPLGGPSNDYHHLPVSDKQLRFARQIAARAALEVPPEAQQDRRAMSAWIDAHLPKRARPALAATRYPSSRQVAFAERIARIKRRNVPRECFRDMGLMSAWIDSNL